VSGKADVIPSRRLRSDRKNFLGILFRFDEQIHRLFSKCVIGWGSTVFGSGFARASLLGNRPWVLMTIDVLQPPRKLAYVNLTGENPYL
jgi:hypothetical protein